MESTSTEALPPPAQLLDAVIEQYLWRKQRSAAVAPTPMETVLLLEEVFDELEQIFFCRKGYNIPAKERKLVDATGGSATYGEALPEAVDALRRVLDLGPGDVLFDLGSGTGRVILQLALQSCHASRLVGIELSPTRHEYALEAAAILRRRGVQAAPMEFVNGDISSCDISEGSHFYMCSTAYSASMCRRVAERLWRSPRFKVLVTSRALPAQPYLTKLGEVPSAYSWNLQGRAFVYVKSLQHAPPQLLAKFCSWDGVAWAPGQLLLQGQGQRQAGGWGLGLLRLPLDEELEPSWPGEAAPVLHMPHLMDPLQRELLYGAASSAAASASSSN